MDVLIDSIVDKDVLDKIKNQEILLYDLNPQSKKMMEWLFRRDVYVKGFLLEDTRRSYSTLKYFNKPMFYFDELCGDEVILDTFGDNTESLKNRTKCKIYSLYNKHMQIKPIIIYGAGKIGGVYIKDF